MGAYYSPPIAIFVVMKKLVCFCWCIFCVCRLLAQPSPPELAQMMASARWYMQAGNYSEATRVYRQALLLQPGNMQVQMALSEALYDAGNYDEAIGIVKPLVGKAGVPDTVSDILVRSQMAAGQRKAATETLDKALGRFPNSGMLWCDKGQLLQARKRPDEALEAWQTGIKRAPGYARNYYYAALAGMDKGQPAALAYGEIYLLHTRDNDTVLLPKMLAGYTTMFANIGGNTSKSYVSKLDDSLSKIFTLLTPVVSDGVGVETLTMARVRFVLEWKQVYSTPLPQPYRYLQSMIADGYFDIWNEWLFGVAESPTAHRAWLNFHKEDMGRLETYFKTHPYIAE